jgi:hypothetical protein
MILQQVVERFENEAPICVMTRATIENVLSEDRLDRLFEETAELQQNKKLMFSTVADIMGLVACKIYPSPHAAFQAKVKEAGVTAKAFYDKLQRMEPNVSRELVRETAARMGQIVEKTKGPLQALLPGYRVKIIDGNHLRRTQRRIKELREINGAPLPGHCLVVLDPQWKLAIDVFPCEDGHAQERSLLGEVLPTVERGDLWVADRNFCTTNYLFGMIALRAHFIIRQHKQALRWELIGRRKKVGISETGVVYEQAMRVFDEDGNERILRRITVELYQPTRDGETEIHVLTNLPKKVSAMKVADLYRKRWTIETAFGEMAKNLEGEVETLGYPRAALFSFCMALVSYNVISVVLSALRAVHGQEVIEERVSLYYLCDEVAKTSRGLSIAVPDSYWTENYATLSAAQLARELVRIAKTVTLSRYRKHKRGPKKSAKTMNKKRRNHVSTARVLANRRAHANTS